MTILAQNQPDKANLIAEDQFLPLVVALRLVYMKTEPAFIDKIQRILEGINDADIQDGVKRVRQDWDDTLSGRRLMVHQTPERTYHPRDVLDTWMYALTLHQDPKRQRHAAELRDFDPTSSWTLQIAVWQLAVAVINLDNVVAYAVGEPMRTRDTAPADVARSGLF